MSNKYGGDKEKESGIYGVEIGVSNGMLRDIMWNT